MLLFGPRPCCPSEDTATYANEAARGSGARVQIADDLAVAVHGSDFMYADD